MKFLIDAQLPKKLTTFLKTKGFDAIHTSELPKRNSTPDSDIIYIADNDNRVIITKDSDFYKLKLLEGKPQKLVFLVTGNISNNHLINIFDKNLPLIIELISEFDIIEINSTSINAK